MPPLVLLVRMIASLLLLTLSTCLLIHASSSASPLCTGSRAPLVLGESTLSFCGYSGNSCCDAVDDAALREQFEAINVSHAACAAVVKSILCAECSTSSAELFDATGSTSKTRSIPLLCRSTPSSSFPHHTHPDDDNYCQLVWQTCKDAAMANSRRFQPLRPLQVASIPSTNDTTRPRSPSSSTKTKLSDFWRSETDFCSSFGSSSSSSACFNGKGVSLLSHSGARPTVKPVVAGATIGSTNGGLLPAEPSLPWKTGLLSFGGIGLFLAWRVYWKEITNGDNGQATTYGNVCSCCNTVMCCVTNNWGMLNPN